MNGTALQSSTVIGNVATSWSVAGTADFNGDGNGDILWYNTTARQIVLWFLNGTSVVGGGSSGSAASRTFSWLSDKSD